MNFRILFIPFVFILCVLLPQQDLLAQKVELNIQLYDLKLKPMVNTEIVFIELETREEVRVQTDGTGKAFAELNGGKEWTMDILEIKNYPYWMVKIPKKGVYKQKRSLTYDYETYLRDIKAPIDRTDIEFETKKSVSRAIKPSPTQAVVRIVLNKLNKRPSPNLPVSLVNFETDQIWSGTTDSKGEIRFLVPMGYEYSIDIEGIENYSYIDVPKRQHGGIYKKGFTFEPMNFTETVVSGGERDTVRQVLPANPEGTSGRVRLKAKFRYSNGTPFANQTAYLKEADTDRIYEVKTNEAGDANVMLPKGKLIEYVTGVINGLEITKEVADLRFVSGIGNMSRTIKLDYQLTNLNTSLQLMFPKELDLLNRFFVKNGIEVLALDNQSVPFYSKNYVCFEDPERLTDMDRGILMTSGSVWNAFGPNDLPGASRALSWYPVQDIPDCMKDTVGNKNAYDACILEFEIVPEKGSLVFEYVMASEEYPEYLEFDDAFGIFVEGEGLDGTQNIARIGESPELFSISNINHESNADFYVSNGDSTLSSYETWQYDGFTRKNVSRVNVTPGKTYKVKWIVFDRIDSIYDTGVFVNMRSE